MEEINKVLATNLKRMRTAKKLSLDNLAKRSDISKSMLSQIEKGEVNPSLASVWKIAIGLEVPFSELLTKFEQPAEIINKKEAFMLSDENGHYRNYSMFCLDEKRRFEMCYVEIDPKAIHQSEGHPKGVQEFLTVFSGCLVVRVCNHELMAEPGCSIRFNADIPHEYENISDEICQFSQIIHYPEP